MAFAAEVNHEAAAHERRVAIVRAMTPSQRLEQALAMNRTMRELLATGFRERNPEWSDRQVRGAVADRILHARTG
jgi:hypothetical protein